MEMTRGFFAALGLAAAAGGGVVAIGSDVLAQEQKAVKEFDPQTVVISSFHEEEGKPTKCTGFMNAPIVLTDPVLQEQAEKAGLRPQADVQVEYNCDKVKALIADAKLINPGAWPVDLRELPFEKSDALKAQEAAAKKAEEDAAAARAAEAALREAAASYENP